MTEQERRELAQQQMAAFKEKFDCTHNRIDVKHGYTKEEAEKEIKRIKKDKEQIYQFENGDGIHCTFYTKEEMIEWVKANIKE